MPFFVSSKTKSLDEERQAQIRSVVAQIVSDRYQGNRSAAAEAFGVSQSYLSTYLNGGTGGGRKILDGLAKVAPERASEVMGFPAPIVMGREPQTLEEYAEAEGLDLNDPKTRALLSTAYQGLVNARQVLDFTARGLKAEMAAAQGKRIDVSRDLGDDEA